VRSRTVLYAAIIVLVGGVMAFSLATRRSDGVSVIHDRNPMYVRLSDGALRNAYTIRILNKTLEPQDFVLTVTGLPDAKLEVIGAAASSGGNPVIDVGPDQTREMRVLITTHQQLAPDASIPIVFTVAAGKAGVAASARDHFVGP